MATWPASLPQEFLAAGYSEQDPDIAIRTQMDVGPAKVRRRQTDGPEPVGGQLRLTPAQKDALKDFIKTTLAGGALPFDWTRTSIGAPRTYRIVGRTTYAPVQRGARWIATLQLEEMV